MAMTLWLSCGTASAQATVSDQIQKGAIPGGGSIMESNPMAYLEIIVIPLLLFILMLGVVRTQKI